jgi:hypothetical protein
MNDTISSRAGVQLMVTLLTVFTLDRLLSPLYTTPYFESFYYRYPFLYVSILELQALNVLKACK